MENVKGILTSQVGGERIFPSILKDLKDPSKAIHGRRTQGKQYRIYSFVAPPGSADASENSYSQDSDYIIRAENFGIPQARHRVILLGVCTDITREPGVISQQEPVNIEHVLIGLPPLRSKLSRIEDGAQAWEQVIREQARAIVRELGRRGPNARLAANIEKNAHALKSRYP